MLFDRSSPSDEPYFEIVAGEIASGQVRTGLWTQCMTDAHFDEGRAKSSYVKQRVKELKIAVAQGVADQKRLEAQATVDEARAKLKELDQQLQGLEPALGRRTSFLIAGVGGGCVVGIVASIWVGPVATVLGGLVGFFCTWFAVVLMPSQHQADQEAARIKSERYAAQMRCREASNIVRKLS